MSPCRRHLVYLYPLPFRESSPSSPRFSLESLCALCGTDCLASSDSPRHYFVHTCSGPSGGPTKVLTLELMKVPYLEKRVFADMKNFMMRSPWAGTSPKSKDWCLCQRGEEAGMQRPTGPRRGGLCADGGGDGGVGMQGLLADPQKLRERHGAGPPRKSQPCRHLSSGLLASRTGRE